MQQSLQQTEKCYVTGQVLPLTDLMRGSAISHNIFTLLQKDHPGLKEEHYVARHVLNDYRARYIQKLLKQEYGELKKLDKEVLEYIHKDELISQNIEERFDKELTMGEKMADKIASFGGSWSFIGLFFLFLLMWMAVNVFILASKAFDPYPFILLNLILSCIAAIQAPIIMMSQNRQEDKDRSRSEHDYKVNLKAELEIRLLHEKMDHLILHQSQRLMEIQQIQIELMRDIYTKLDNNTTENPEENK